MTDTGQVRTQCVLYQEISYNNIHLDQCNEFDIVIVKKESNIKSCYIQHQIEKYKTTLINIHKEIQKKWTTEYIKNDFFNCFFH